MKPSPPDPLSHAAGEGDKQELLASLHQSERDFELEADAQMPSGVSPSPAAWERGSGGEGWRTEIRHLGRALADALRRCLELLAGLSGNGKTRPLRPRRPWQIRVRPLQRSVSVKQSDVDRLLQRHRDLKDAEKIAELSARFHVPESDFFADPKQVERLIAAILKQNPPWLYVARTLSGGEQGADTHSPEFLWREQETHVVEDATLFIPEENWRDMPLSSLTMRSTRSLDEVWQARLLDQILPPEVMMERHTRGEILIPVRQGRKQRIHFRSEERRIDVMVRRPVPIPIEMEGGSGSGGQLLYILLDYSASMRGKSATLAMAAIAAALRANMGQRDTRYLFRRYAEELWPRQVQPPMQARTLAEKDALLDEIFTTNFNGGATHVNEALNVAATDIEHLRQTEHLEAQLLLVTDGRAEILESTRLHLRAADVKVHTVMVMPDRNPSLETLSESFTILNIGPDQPRAVLRAPAKTPVPPPRHYRI